MGPGIKNKNNMFSHTQIIKSCVSLVFFICNFLHHFNAFYSCDNSQKGR